MTGERGRRFAGKWAICPRSGDICTMQQVELKWGEGYRAARELPDLEGAVVFASAEEQAQRSTELLGRGALLITLPPPTVEARGHLGDLLEELVERELARMGAPSPYLAAWAAMPEDAEARLADQLFRTRTVGATGLAIAMGTLAGIATPVLNPDDSATLRWLATTTRHAPLVLMIDDADGALSAYAAPVPLATVVAQRRDDGREIPGTHEDLVPIEIELGMMEIDLSADDATRNETRVESIELAEAIVTAVAAPSVDGRTLGARIRDERDGRADAPHERDGDLQATPEATPVHGGATVIAEAAPTPEDPPEAPAPPDAAPPPDAAACAKPPSPREAPSATRRATRATAGVEVRGPGDEWRSWAITLAAARGAQPLAAFERLFAESYVPLSNAIASGLDDPRAVRAYDEFRRSFERSYTDAFATFGATNRRPRLVMDAYDVATKQARLANARSAHVLVVDSMRFDLGCMVRDALRREVNGVATLTSETLLWSALPTTTTRQLETFARGLDALRAPAHEEPSESLRGRAAEVVRRVRVGSRELYKLDLVPSLLEALPPGIDLGSSLGEIAEATTEAIARHISTLPARTLLLLVGDHGFGIDRRGQVQVGGASPEEVLVPAFSWLIGELH